MDHTKRPRGGHCSNLDDSAQASKTRWRQQLNRLETLNQPLLAIGAGKEGKAPADPRTGFALEGWPGASHTIQQIQTAHPKVIAAGMRTGNGMLVFDIDGDSAWELLLQCYGCDPEATTTWQIHRTTSVYRIKVAFRISAEQQQQLGSIHKAIKTLPPTYADRNNFGFDKKGNRIPDGQLLKKGEALELFASPTAQVITIGQHPSSGGRYFWPKGKGPEALAPIPDDWWAMALDIATDGKQWRQSARLVQLNDNQKNSHTRKGGSTRKGDWRSLPECPICGRNTTSYCAKHRDGRTIRCFHGSTFSPPTGLKRGETITDREGKIWAFSREQQQANGDLFSVFVEHDPHRRPKPSTEIRRLGPSGPGPGPGARRRTGLRPADHIAPAGQYLGQAVPLPTPAAAPLVVMQAPMGCGKTQAIQAGIAPRIGAGIPTLLPTHRIALGKAICERLGVEFAPLRSDPLRQLGGGMCFDSLCPTSGLRIGGDSWTGATMVLDEWMQALEHLLFSHGTKLAKRRAAVLRTFTELLSRSGQIIAADAQLADWAITLLEVVTNRTATLIRSDHQPMAGRQLHHHTGQAIKPTAEAFRAKWDELVTTGATFFCWSSAQQETSRNSPQTLAALHQQRRPGARVCMIDSTTPELAAELAADPDGFAAQYDAIYCSPSISSGVSFEHWQPDAVLIFSGGHIGPEHVAQACARVRSCNVPAYVFAPNRSPGNGLRVGSGSIKPNDLISELRSVTDPLLGQLKDAGDAWLQAWATLAATRNRQRHAYGSTVIQLLQREGWTEASSSLPPEFGDKTQRATEFTLQVQAAAAAQVARLVAAEPITAHEACDIEKTAPHQRTSEERDSLERFKLTERWALPPDADITEQQVKAIREADTQGLRQQLRLGWLITDRTALSMLPGHDFEQIKALDLDQQQPFSPDRLRVTLAPKVYVLHSLGIHKLIQRFEAGETIAADDIAIQRIHCMAQIHKEAITTALGITAGKKPTCTVRRLLAACGWNLTEAGRIKTRGARRDLYQYKATRLATPDGIDHTALVEQFKAELRAPEAAGAKTFPLHLVSSEKKSPTLGQRARPIPHAAAPFSSVGCSPPRSAPPRGFG